MTIILDFHEIILGTDRGLMEQQIQELIVAVEAESDPEDAEQYRDLLIDSKMKLIMEDHMETFADGSRAFDESYDYDEALAQVLSEIDD